MLVSKKLIRILHHDFALFGSIPFYLFISVFLFLLGEITLFHQLIIALFLSYVLIVIIRGTYHRERPIKEDYTIFMEKIYAASFPSFHSLNITIMAILISWNFKNAMMAVIFILLGALVYSQRFVAKKHYITDVIGGIILGIAESILVIYLI